MANVSGPVENGLTIEERDFPALFQAADAASLHAQCMFNRLILSDLCLVVLGAVVSSIPIQDPRWKGFVAMVGAMLLVGSFFVTIWIRISSSEKVWYGGRAVAESVKTLSWRYMMGAHPYGLNLSETQVDSEFANALKKIFSERRELAVEFDEQFNTGDQVTAKMREARKLPCELRRKIYVAERISNQRTWYSKKAKWNQRRERGWFGMVLLVQALAFMYALWIVRAPQATNWVGVLSALATAVLMWLQVKKFRELAQAYSVTAQDLGLVEIDAQRITDEATLADFISNAENAISREHTLWVARRDH